MICFGLKDVNVENKETRNALSFHGASSKSVSFHWFETHKLGPDTH